MNTLSPKISIITPSYNQGAFIRETIESVLEQNYPNLEYIIVDGGSNDESVDIIREHENKLAWWVSEPDDGQAHAINKGLENVTGEWVGFLNSDDILKPGALQEIARLADQHKPDWIAGAVHIFDDNGKSYSVKNPQPSAKIGDWLVYDAQTPQQGSFWKRELLQKTGMLNQDLHYAFDMEFWIRLTSHGYQPLVSDKTLAGFRIHDVTKSMGGRSSFIIEHRKILDMYREKMSKAEISSTEKKLSKMMAEALVYEAAALAELGDKEKAEALIKKATQEFHWIQLRRSFWGAKRRIRKAQRK